MNQDQLKRVNLYILDVGDTITIWMIIKIIIPNQQNNRLDFFVKINNFD